MNKYRCAIKAVFAKGIVDIRCQEENDYEPGAIEVHYTYELKNLGTWDSFSGKVFSSKAKLQNWIKTHTMCVISDREYIISHDYFFIGIIDNYSKRIYDFL